MEVSTSGLRFLRDVSQAPEEVLALTDELNNLQNVLTAVGLVTRKRRDDFLGILLSPLFDNVNHIVIELCDLCGTCPQKLKEDEEYTEQLKLRLLARFKWTLAKKRVDELREKLKVVRLDFSNSLAATSLTSAKLSISYRFPEWLLNRLVSSVIISNHVNGPQLSLVVPRIVPNTSDIFSQSFAGNIDAVAKLIQAGLASPCDINGMWGYTPLHYALDRGHMELCRFLLKAGARAEITDIEDSSVTDMAWNKICLKKVSSKEAEELEGMFKKDGWFEERQFTTLHKTILGLLPTPQDLQRELSMSTKNIEVADSEGRTPLSWAAELGNLSAVQILLQYGAACSSKSINGMTPLHYAAKASSPACLHALLENGAPVSAKNKWNQSPLNIASYSQNDESFINPLLDHGADINERDVYGSSALSCAVFMNQYHTARCLLARGASVGTKDLNVMNDSIENNSHECTSLLLNSRANLSTANIHGETSLHALARRGDLRSIELFQAAELEGLDAEAKTNERLTPWDVMTQRVDVTDEVQNAFRGLMAKIRSDNKCMTCLGTLEKMPPIVGKVPDQVEVRVEEILVD
ncbi:MAG: hypothetical protein Q9225_005081 [Loekoesia sp. 1 TL-2023]